MLAIRLVLSKLTDKKKDIFYTVDELPAFSSMKISKADFNKFKKELGKLQHEGVLGERFIKGTKTFLQIKTVSLMPDSYSALKSAIKTVSAQDLINEPDRYKEHLHAMLHTRLYAILSKNYHNTTKWHKDICNALGIETTYKAMEKFLSTI